MAESVWTDSEKASVSRLWRAGWTAGRIAETMPGRTRNSIIGVIHRMKLEKRPNPCAKTANPSPEALYRRAWRRKQKLGEAACEEFAAARRARTVHRRSAKPTQPAKVIPLPVPKPKPARHVDRLGKEGCQWLEGERPAWTKCGAARFIGSSWCEEHYHRVFQPRPKVTA